MISCFIKGLVIYASACDIKKLILNIWTRVRNMYFHMLEAVVQKRSVKKMFLEIWQNSQENNCARVPFLIHFYIY